jgi:hypothetical protein
MDRFKAKVGPLTVAMAATQSRPTKPRTSPSSTNPAAKFTPEVVVAVKAATVELEAEEVTVVKVVVVNTPQLNTLALAGMGASTATIPASQTPSAAVLTARGTKIVVTNAQAVIATTTAAPTAGNVRTASATTPITPMAALVEPVAMAAAAEPAVMAAVDVATTKAFTTAEVDLAEVLVLMAPAVPVEAPMLDQVDLAARAVTVEPVEPAETAGTGARTVATEHRETLARPVPRATLALTATALVDLVVLLAKVAQVVAADLVVAHAAPTSQTVDHFLSLITAL